MKPELFKTDRLVKSEDLNHHRTLFAGRCAEWFVEAGFIAAASVLPADHIVCLKIHGLSFTRPVKSGDIARFESKIILTGRSSLMVHVALKHPDQEQPVVKGFITFVHVDQKGKTKPHGLNLTVENPEDIALQEEAKRLRRS